MEGIIKANETLFMVSGIGGLGFTAFYPSPTLAPWFIIVSVSLIGFATIIHKHNGYIIKNTMNMRVISPDGRSNWSASIRTDRISNQNYRCVYRVYFTISRDEVETVQDGNVTTFTGDKVRIQEEGVREIELYCDWIGKNGEEIDGNVWRNKFATTIKRNYKGRISVLCCGYIRQEHI